MTSQELFILVLRGIGLWAIIQAASGICMAIASVVNMWDIVKESSGDLSMIGLLVNTSLQPVVVVLVAAFLLFRADRISKFFYGEPEADEQPLVLALTSEDVYRTFAQVLGLYAMLWGVGPLSHVVATVVRWDESARLSTRDVAEFVRVVLYLGCAFGMIFGAKRIARWLSKLRHVPEVTESSATQREADDATEPP